MSRTHGSLRAKLPLTPSCAGTRHVCACGRELARTFGLSHRRPGDQHGRHFRPRQSLQPPKRRLIFLIVEARFYDDLADALLDGAKAALDEAGATYDVVTVPGALEIPAVDFLRARRRGRGRHRL